MPQAHIREKRIISFIALLLFAAGVFFWAVLPLLRTKAGQAPFSNTPSLNDPSGDRYAEGQSCVADDKQVQDQDNDVLFIGCNGFF